MRKIDHRNEMDDLNVDATDGQIADYLSSELSGENIVWNIGIVEYYCANGADKRSTEAFGILCRL